MKNSNLLVMNRVSLLTMTGIFSMIIASCTGGSSNLSSNQTANLGQTSSRQAISSVSASTVATIPAPVATPIIKSSGLLLCPDGSRPNLDSPDPCPGSGLLVCSGAMTPVSNKCICPANAYSAGDACINCDANQLFNPTMQMCVAKVSCNSGYTYDGHSCVAITQNCQSYQEVVDSNFAVPARDSSNTCYYIKLTSAVASQSSMNIIPRRTDVVARNHDTWNGNQAPHVMGDRSLSFKIMGPRQVVLSGDTHGGADIYVDNFFLVEVGLPGATSPALWASGTGDAPPVDASGNQTPILVGGQPVTNYHAYQAGGTSNFKAYDFSPMLDIGENVTFRGSALDCGGAAYSSDVYLVFK